MRPFQVTTKDGRTKVLAYPGPVARRKDKNREFNATLVPRLRTLPEDAAAVKPAALTPQSQVRFSLEGELGSKPPARKVSTAV